jgi:hypothetical protein
LLLSFGEGFGERVCSNKMSKEYPGSEIPGVPASETKATFLPSLKALKQIHFYFFHL